MYESFGRNHLPQKKHHQLWDTQKLYPFNKGRFPKKHLLSQNDPWNSRLGSHPRPKRTQQTDGKVPRLASAWTKIFKVAASWSRHVFGKTPGELWVFQRFEHHHLWALCFLPYIVSIHRFLKRAQVYSRMVVHHWSAKIFNWYIHAKHSKWSNHQSLWNTRETNFAKSSPKDMMFNKLPFTSLYDYAWGSLSRCFLQRFIHGSQVDCHGRLWSMAVQHQTCLQVWGLVLFLFFSGLLRIWLR